VEAALKSFPADIKPLLQTFVNLFRERNIEILQKAYSSVDMATAKALLGLAADDKVKQELEKKGFKVKGSYAYPGEENEGTR